MKTPHVLLLASAIILLVGLFLQSVPFMSLGLAIAGFGLSSATSLTRGPGSWATDRVLTLLAGACLGASFAVLLVQ